MYHGVAEQGCDADRDGVRLRGEPAKLGLARERLPPRGARYHVWPLVVLNAAALALGVRLLNGGLGEWGGDNVRFLLLAEALAGGRGFVDLSLLGHPPELAYPPLYPILLAPLVWAGAPLIVLKAITAALGLAGLNACYLLLAGWHDRCVALLIALATACCGAFLDSGLSIMSESPYLLMSSVTVLLVQKSFDAAERRHGLWIATGAMMGLSVLTRLIGVVIAPATILFAWFLPSPRSPLGERMRRLVIIGAAAGVLVGPWLARGLVHEASAPGGYYREFERGDTIREKIRVRSEEAPEERSFAERMLVRPVDNLWDLGTRLRRTAVPEAVRDLGPGWAAGLSIGLVALGVLFAGLSLLGLVLGLWSRRRAHDFYVLSYLALLSVWIGGGFRLLMPVLPFLFAYVHEAVSSLGRSGARARRAGLTVLVLAIAANLVVTFRFPLIRDRLAGRYEPWWSDLLAVSCKLGETARPGQTVIAAPDNVVYYFSGLEAVRIRLTGDTEAVAERVLASGADYVVVTPFERWRYKKTRRAIAEHPDLFPVIIAEGEVQVHRVLRGPASETGGRADDEPPPTRSPARCAEIVP